MQLLLLSLHQPHFQVNNHSPQYQNVLYALAPNRLKREELHMLCECLQMHGVLHLGLTRKQQTTQGWE